MFETDGGTEKTREQAIKLIALKLNHGRENPYTLALCKEAAEVVTAPEAGHQGSCVSFLTQQAQKWIWENR